MGNVKVGVLQCIANESNVTGVASELVRTYWSFPCERLEIPIRKMGFATASSGFLRTKSQTQTQDLLRGIVCRHWRESRVIQHCLSKKISANIRLRTKSEGDSVAFESTSSE
jgi:hypothetical protein